MLDNLQSRNKFRVVFLVVASGGFIFDLISTVQKLTWVRKFDYRVTTLFVKGNGELGRGVASRFDLHDTKIYGHNPIFQIEPAKLVRSDTLLVTSTKGYDQIVTNTLAGISWVEKNLDYDFLIRTNVSTFWNMDALNNFLSGLSPVKYLYLGNIASNLGQTYVEGDGIILSRETVKILLKNKNLIDSGIIDDVSIGMALKQLGICPINLSRPWFRKLTQVKSLSLTELQKTVSYRCKAEYRLFGLYIRLDPLLMFFLNFRISRL